MPKLGIKKTRRENKVYYPYRGYSNAVRVIKLLERTQCYSTNEMAEKLGGIWPYSHRRILHLLERLKSLEYVEKFRLLTNKNHTCTYCKKSTRYLENENNIEKQLDFLEENKKKNSGLVANKDTVLGRLIFPRCFGCGETGKDYGHLDDEYHITKYRYWGLSNNGLFAKFLLLNGSKRYAFVKSNNSNNIFHMIDVFYQNQQKELVDRLLYNLERIFLIKPTVYEIAEEWHREMIKKITSMNISKKQNPTLLEYQKEIRWVVPSSDVQRFKKARNIS